MGPKIFGSKKILGPKNFKVQKIQVQKIQVQTCLISHESLSLEFHAILLARSGDIGFVSVVESSIG